MFLVTFLANKPLAWGIKDSFFCKSIREGLLIEFDLNSYPDKSEESGLAIKLY